MTASPTPARLILASASPRRRALLQAAGLAFEIATSGVDEHVPAGTAPRDAARLLAERKARAVQVTWMSRAYSASAAADSPGASVARGGPEMWILAADTIVALDAEMLGKPVDASDAVRILRRLAGREHTVFTGVAVLHRGRVFSDVAATRVAFRPLTEGEIAAYVATGEPMDKAGAYAVQGGARVFIERIDGPLDNVVGLPMDLALRLLGEAGHPLP